MTQSRKMSALETGVSTAIGLTVSYLGVIIALPLVGLKSNTAQDLGLVAFFTVLSLVRGYAIRRLFNYIESKRNASASD